VEREGAALRFVGHLLGKGVCMRGWEGDLMFGAICCSRRV